MPTDSFLPWTPNYTLDRSLHRRPRPWRRRDPVQVLDDPKASAADKAGVLTELRGAAVDRMMRGLK